MRLHVTAAWIILSATLSIGARAGSFDYSFNAFGTLGVVHSSEDQADFVTNLRQPAGAGFTREWSATPDSKIGAQLTATFWDRLRAMAQAISQYQADGSYRPKVEWANLQYRVTPDADLRVGRIALPTFLYSDTVNVGYALPYVRVPLEVVLHRSAASNDGVDGEYRFHIGGATTAVHAFIGQFNSDVPSGYYKSHRLRGLATTVEDDALTLHLSYQTLHYDYAQGGIVYNVDDYQSMLSVGASYDPGGWYILGEGYRSADATLGLHYGGYLFGGYRFNQFTAYLGFARAYNDATGNPNAGSNVDQRTDSLGVRWDFARHFDAKFQFDRMVLHGGLGSPFLNQQPAFNTRNTVHVLSLAMDFSW